MDAGANSLAAISSRRSGEKATRCVCQSSLRFALPAERKAVGKRMSFRFLIRTNLPLAGFTLGLRGSSVDFYWYFTEYKMTDPPPPRACIGSIGGGEQARSLRETRVLLACVCCFAPRRKKQGKVCSTFFTFCRRERAFRLHVLAVCRWKRKRR